MQIEQLYFIAQKEPTKWKHNNNLQTEVFGQMRKLWRLAERKAETYSCSGNGQSNRIWNRSGGGGEIRHGTDCRTRLLRKFLSTLFKELQNLPIIAVREKGQKIRFLIAQ